MRGLPRLAALHDAAVEVLETESHSLAIQRRFQSDMHDLWVLQARLERRTGKSPYSVINHPRYRAGYDFLLLRAQMGEVPEALPVWWDHFVQADSDERAEMVKAAQIEARQTGEDARRGRVPRCRPAVMPRQVRSENAVDRVVVLVVREAVVLWTMSAAEF